MNLNTKNFVYVEFLDEGLGKVLVLEILPSLPIPLDSMAFAPPFIFFTERELTPDIKHYYYYCGSGSTTLPELLCLCPVEEAIRTLLNKAFAYHLFQALVICLFRCP